MLLKAVDSLINGYSAKPNTCNSTDRMRLSLKAIIYTAVIFLSQQIIISYSDFFKRNYWKTSICWDEYKIRQVYKYMIDSARRETYGLILNAVKDYFSLFQFNTVGNDDLGFYKVYFGVAKVVLPENGGSLNSITYHRIFKNGNDNIRYLLYRFVSTLYDSYSSSTSQKEVVNTSSSSNSSARSFHRISEKEKCYDSMCSNSSKAHLVVDSLSHPHMQHHSIFYECPVKMNEKSLLFTFVRDPLTRFISAVTEVRKETVFFCLLDLKKFSQILTEFYEVKITLNNNRLNIAQCKKIRASTSSLQSLAG